MTNWNQVGFDHYRSAPNGGIIWISPDDDRPEGYSIILNKDGETKELGFAEDLGDAKDIADRECRAMESEDAILGSYDGQVKVGDWKIEDKKLSWELSEEQNHPLGKTIANLKTAIKDAEKENTGDDWEDSTIGGRFKQLDESMKIVKTAAKEAVEKAGHAGVDTDFWQRYIGKDEPDDIDDISRACSLMLKDPKILEDACKQVLEELKGKYAKEIPK